jgi:hypothetical protein
MAKSKARKASKSEDLEKDKKVLVQVRIPEEEHRLLSALCLRYGQTIAHRLHTIIQQELNNCYPVAVVSFDRKSIPTHVIIERYSMPDEEFWSVTMTPEDAKGILPEVLQYGTSISFPYRTPKIFGIESNYQDVLGVWHLQLRKIGVREA